MPKKPVKGQQKQLLDQKRERFCLEYLKDQNGTQAVIRTGCYTSDQKSAAVQASRLLRDAKVLQRISELDRELRNETNTDITKVRMRLAEQAYADPLGTWDENGCVRHPMHWPEDLRRAMASYDVIELFDSKGPEKKLVGYLKKVKFWNKLQALELLGDHRDVGAYKERLEGRASTSLEQLVVGSQASPPIPKKGK